jgi:hypothetical protein
LQVYFIISDWTFENFLQCQIQKNIFINKDQPGLQIFLKIMTNIFLTIYVNIRKLCTIN